VSAWVWLAPEQMTSQQELRWHCSAPSKSLKGPEGPSTPEPPPNGPLPSGPSGRRTAIAQAWAIRTGRKVSLNRLDKPKAGLAELSPTRVASRISTTGPDYLRGWRRPKRTPLRRIQGETPFGAGRETALHREMQSRSYAAEWSRTITGVSTHKALKPVVRGDFSFLRLPQAP